MTIQNIRYITILQYDLYIYDNNVINTISLWYYIHVFLDPFFNTLHSYFDISQYNTRVFLIVLNVTYTRLVKNIVSRIVLSKMMMGGSYLV